MTGRMIATVAAVVVICADCAGATGRPSGSPAPSPSATASSCEATVLALLSESADAAQEGYSGGLDPSMVMSRYCEQSAVFQVWEQLDGQVLAAQAAHGPDGLLAPFVPQIIRLCAQYGGQPQQRSPAT